jgi:hypothetical protein
VFIGDSLRIGDRAAGALEEELADRVVARLVHSRGDAVREREVLAADVLELVVDDAAQARAGEQLERGERMVLVAVVEKVDAAELADRPLIEELLRDEERR